MLQSASDQFAEFWTANIDEARKCGVDDSVLPRTRTTPRGPCTTYGLDMDSVAFISRSAARRNTFAQWRKHTRCVGCVRKTHNIFAHDWFLSDLYVTSSSAVAKRPRDASCLSVVSFNSTKRRVVFYCWLRRLQICHCVQLNALFCRL